MRMAMLVVALGAALMSAAGGVLAQIMYEYRDASGNVVFSDHPPARGVPYTTRGSAAALPPSNNPSVPQPAAAVPLPTAPVQAPRALPGEAAGNVPPGLTVPVDPNAARDRGAFMPQGNQRQDRDAVREFVPQGEAQRERDSLRANVPAGERATDRSDVRQNIPAGEAAAERSAERQFVPQGEAARERRDRQFGVPAGERQTEQDSLRLNQ